MIRGFAANLSMLFTEVPFLDRFDRAAKAGFEFVEAQFPYEAPADTVAERLKAAGLTMVLHNLPAGDWGKGDRGVACQPARVDEFRTGVAKAVRYAKALGVDKLNCLAGLAPEGVAEADVRRTFIENLRFASKALAEAGIKLLIEPVNRRDVPGFWLDTPSKALGVIEEAGVDNLYLQYDVYHAQRSEGELAATMQKNLARIAHVQIADNPGRNEPGTGEINYPFLFELLHKSGYDGYVAGEYKPAAATEAGLGWLEKARQQTGAR